jgi:hypothetical protein
MKNIVLISGLLVATLSSCSKNTNEQSVSVCGVANPLTDLDWLKEFIRVHEENAADGYKSPVRVYQYTYNDSNIAFLLELCEGCPFSFAACDGTRLCSGGGFIETNDCEGFNFDEKNKKLIYQLN